MDPIRGAVAGAIGGAAGAYTMELFQQWWNDMEKAAAPKHRAHAIKDATQVIDMGEDIVCRDHACRASGLADVAGQCGCEEFGQRFDARFGRCPGNRLGRIYPEYAAPRRLKKPKKRSIVRANIDHQISVLDLEALHDISGVSLEVVDEHR
jgi:hypothetical protein